MDANPAGDRDSCCDLQAHPQDEGLPQWRRQSVCRTLRWITGPTLITAYSNACPNESYRETGNAWIEHVTSEGFPIRASGPVRQSYW
jgi:hypothetical protein